MIYSTFIYEPMFVGKIRKRIKTSLMVLSKLIQDPIKIVRFNKALSISLLIILYFIINYFVLERSFTPKYRYLEKISSPTNSSISAAGTKNHDFC